MKPVNLLPPELAAEKVKTPILAPQEEQSGFGHFLILGALALIAAGVAAFVLTNNSVKEHRSELANAKAELSAVQKQTTALKPYADFAALVQDRVLTVTALAKSRFNWDRAVKELSRALPRDVTLTSLTGTVSSKTTVAGGGAASGLRANIDAPAIELAGCARTQRSVAHLMARLHNVTGVTRVSLAKSDKESTATTAGSTVGSSSARAACAGASPPTFQVVAFFEGAPVPPGVGSAATAPAPSTSGQTQSGASSNQGAATK